MLREEILIMKKKIFAASGILLAVVIGLILFWTLRDTDEKRIRRTLDELCRIGTKSSGENPALGALKANRADRVFAPRCRFNFRVNTFDGEYTPTEIGAKILRIQTMFQWLKLSTSEVEISVQQGTGRVFFTGELSGVTKHGRSEKINEIRDIEASLVKNDKGEWKFSAMKIRNVLEK